MDWNPGGSMTMLGVVQNLSVTSGPDTVTVAQLQFPPAQPFNVAEAFTGSKGKYVKLAETVRSFKEVIDGKHDDLPEQAFYMVGGIEEVLEKAERLKSGK